MTPISFWFDPISPYATLAFERLPQALAGCSYVVRYRPVLFAAMLGRWGQLGPAEIEPKRAWTFRQVAWLAHRHGIELQPPARHPFNPLPLLRLLHACDDSGLGPNRHQCELVLRHVWRGGAAADDPLRLAALTRQLAPALDARSDAVRTALRAATDEALARGVFGVPTIELPPRAGDSDARLFWGLDSLEMVAAALRGEAWFDGPGWVEGGRARAGIARRQEPLDRGVNVMANDLRFEEVLSFWFGAEPGVRRAEWFRKDPAFDALVGERFGALVDAAVAGEIDGWMDSPRSALARLIVLDQFTRNIHRDTARAFAGDALALAAARDIIERGWDRGYLGVQRGFAYLPFEHAEDLAMQREALRLFAQLGRDEPAQQGLLEWAQKHHDIVARFGRFPHRNVAVGRASTAEELTFLAQPGSSF